jgi:hypothetical protein
MRSRLEALLTLGGMSDLKRRQRSVKHRHHDLIHVGRITNRSGRGIRVTLNENVLRIALDAELIFCGGDKIRQSEGHRNVAGILAA